MSTSAAPADAALVVSVQTVLGLVSGRLPLRRALDTGAIEASGDLGALAELPQLFDVARQVDQAPAT